MKLRQMVLGAGGIWLGIVAANVFMAALEERLSIADAVRHLLSDWPFLIYFYFLVLISVALGAFFSGRRSQK